MENQPGNRTTLIAVVTGIVALLLGLCGGAVLGGFTGYALGERAALRSFEQPALGNPAPFGGSRATPIIPRPNGGTGLTQGVFVQDVVAGSPAEQAGLQAGDIITAVDNVPLDANHRLADVLAQHKPGDTVRLTFARGGSTRDVSVRLGSAPSNGQAAYLGVRYTQIGASPASPAP